MTETERRAKFLAMAREVEPVLVRVAVRFWGGRRDAALDTVQDTLILAYQGYMAGKCRDDGFRPWLLAILWNRLRTDVRRTDRLVSWEDRPSAHESADPSPAADPLQALLRSEDARAVEEAVATLPEAQRLCLVLVDIEGMEYIEAAAVMKIPVGTVRSRLSRARLKVAEALMLREAGAP